MTLRTSTAVSLLVWLLGVVAADRAYPSPRYLLATVDTTAYVLSVSDSVEIRRLPFHFRGYGRALSPDFRWVAFVPDHDLCLLDLVSGELRALTTLPLPPDGHNGCIARVTQWALDGRKLLYCVARDYGDAVCPGSPTYYIYDTITGVSTSLELPGQFEYWLPNGDVVVTIWHRDKDGDAGSVWRPELHVFTPNGSTSLAPLTPPSSEEYSPRYNQITSNPAGTKLAMYDHPPPDSTGRVVEVDLATRRMTPVATLAGCNRCERPSYSRLGSHLSVLDRTPCVPHGPGGNACTVVRVDGRPVFSCRGRLPSDAVSWLSDSLLAVVRGDSLQLINVDEGTHVVAAVAVR